jgi:hypothetical protein
VAKGALRRPSRPSGPGLGVARDVTRTSEESGDLPCQSTGHLNARPGLHTQNLSPGRAGCAQGFKFRSGPRPRQLRVKDQ